jgi:hypothetical protein
MTVCEVKQLLGDGHERISLLQECPVPTIWAIAPSFRSHLRVSAIELEPPRSIFGGGALHR